MRVHILARYLVDVWRHSFRIWRYSAGAVVQVQAFAGLCLMMKRIFLGWAVSTTVRLVVSFDLEDGLGCRVEWHYRDLDLVELGRMLVTWLSRLCELLVCAFDRPPHEVTRL